MLELALLFQPVDEGMAQYGRAHGSDQPQPPIYYLDCQSLTTDRLEEHVSEIIEDMSNQVCVSQVFS